MNKYLIMILLLLAATTSHAKKVMFAVDMTGQTVNSLGVHVSGDFQAAAGFEGGDWQPGTTLMTNETSTEIYSVVVDIPAFTKYQYKFLNGDQWYDVEFVPVESRVGYDFNDNRWVFIDSLYNDTTVIRPVLYSGNAPAGQYLLRLMVDMQMEAAINPAGIHVAGDFQDWDPSRTVMYSFVDKVYEYIAYVDIESGYSEYRFINGNTAGNYEIVPSDCSANGNRALTILKDTVTEAYCFSSCSACGPQWIPDVHSSPVAKLFPNPCKDFTILEFNDSETSHLVIIMDLLGNVQHVYIDCRTKTLEIQCDNLKKGVYFVKINNGQRWLSTLRLVISQ